MRTRAFAAVFLVVAFAAPSQAANADRAAARGLAWEKDFRSATTRARTERKIVMVDFWAAWCTYCEKLDRTTYRDPGVIGRLAKTTVAVKVNTEGRRDEIELADLHGVEGLPTIGFFTPEGRAISRINGYVDAAAFVKLLDKAEIMGADMTAWERTLVAKPKDFAALYGLGSRLFELGYQDDARALLERARAADSGPLRERKRVRMILAMLVEQSTGAADSETMFREALALPPEPDMDPRLEVLLANCLRKLGKESEAKERLRAVVRAYPGHEAAAMARRTLATLK